MFNMRAPHFLESEVDGIEFSELLPNYDTLPPNFKNVVPFLVASLVYHETWLRTTLPASHPIFRSKLFTIHNANVKLMKPMIHGGPRDDGDLPLTGKFIAGDAVTGKCIRGNYAPQLATSPPIGCHSAAWPQPCCRSAAWLQPCCCSAAWLQPCCCSPPWLQPSCPRPACRQPCSPGATRPQPGPRPAGRQPCPSPPWLHPCCRRPAELR